MEAHATNDTVQTVYICVVDEQEEGKQEDYKEKEGIRIGIILVVLPTHPLLVLYTTVQIR